MNSSSDSSSSSMSSTLKHPCISTIACRQVNLPTNKTLLVSSPLQTIKPETLWAVILWTKVTSRMEKPDKTNPLWSAETMGDNGLQLWGCCLCVLIHILLWSFQRRNNNQIHHTSDVAFFFFFSPPPTTQKTGGKTKCKFRTFLISKFHQSRAELEESIINEMCFTSQRLWGRCSCGDKTREAFFGEESLFFFPDNFEADFRELWQQV